MDQHPYFILIAAWASVIALLVAVCLVFAALLLNEKWRDTAELRRARKEADREHAAFKAQAAAFFAEHAQGETGWPQ